MNTYSFWGVIIWLTRRIEQKGYFLLLFFSMALEEKKEGWLRGIKATADAVLVLEDTVFWNLHLYGFWNIFEVLPNKISQSSFENKNWPFFRGQSLENGSGDSSELNHSTSDFLLSSVTNAVSAFPPSFIYQYIVPSYALLKLLNVIVLWWKIQQEQCIKMPKDKPRGL